MALDSDLTATTSVNLPAPAPAAARSDNMAATTCFLRVDGGNIAYDDTGGCGPLIIAIPGMGDLRSEYRLLRPLLREAGYRVVTMDVRGFGETSAQWTDYSAHAVGRDALAVIKFLNAGPAVVLGNSFAAGSALWAAHDAPECVKGVVLLGPIVRDLTVPRFANLALKIGFGGPWRIWFWTTYWNSLFPTRKPLDQDRIKATLARNLREPGRMAALRTMIWLSKADTAAILAQNLVPALVVMGTRDPDFADATVEAKWLTAKLRATLVMVDGAGHYPHVEMPNSIETQLLKFIAQAHR